MNTERLGDPRPLPVWTKLALAFEVVRTYVHARVRLRRRDVRSALASLRGATTSPAIGEAAYGEAARLGGVVARVLAPLPADSRCLMTSVVLSTMLARRGIECPVVIGVKSGSAFGAHAWVELDGRPLLPADEAEFERLVTL